MKMPLSQGLKMVIPCDYDRDINITSKNLEPCSREQVLDYAKQIEQVVMPIPCKVMVKIEEVPHLFIKF